MKLSFFTLFVGINGQLTVNTRFNGELRLALNQFLNSLNASAEPLEENERFYSHNTAVLQDFLMEHGKLPVNHEFDSLGIGTLQGHLKKLGYYHDEPCGVFGPGTTSALQTFLKDKGFYRYPVNGNFDGATKAAMNEFLHNYQNPDSTYRRQYSNLWTRSTTEGMRQKDGVKNAERELGNGKQQKHYSNF